MDGRSISHDERQSSIWLTGCRVEGLLICIALALGVAALLAVAPGAPGSRWERFGLFGFFALWIVLPWFLLVCGVLRPWRMRARAKAGLALLLLFGWSLAVGGIAFELMAPLGVIEVARGEFLLDIAMVGGILVGSLGLAGWQASRLWHWRSRSSAAEAEAWTARLQPHFLFNSLNGISELVASDAVRAERMIEALSRILRASMRAQASVPLGNELALVRDYLALESMRLDTRLRVRWEVVEPLPQLTVPALCLQTLVENAVRHGIARCPGGGELRITVREEDARLAITVANDLPPGGEDRRADGEGVGLASTRARLRDQFGPDASLETVRSPGCYRARMRLPLPDPSQEHVRPHARHRDR